MVYTLAGKNLGNLTETDIVITDVLPARTTFVSTTGGGVYPNGTVTEDSQRPDRRRSGRHPDGEGQPVVPPRNDDALQHLQRDEPRSRRRW
jgi:uncharacterized repeat protein (TIGR01451 family)